MLLLGVEERVDRLAQQVLELGSAPLGQLFLETFFATLVR
jgi:hypothetical protein